MGESHVAGNFVIMRVLYEAGDIISFEFTTDIKGDETFFVYLNRDKIKTDCHKAIKQFLFKIHILRWTGDYEKGKEFFEGYSTVDEFFLKSEILWLETRNQEGWSFKEIYLWI